MNKRQARKEGMENGRTVAELRALIKGARGRGGMSAVNPAISHGQALDIFEAALNGMDDDHIIVGMKPDPFSRDGRMKATGGALTVANILRCCA